MNLWHILDNVLIMINLWLNLSLFSQMPCLNLSIKYSCSDSASWNFEFNISMSSSRIVIAGVIVVNWSYIFYRNCQYFTWNNKVHLRNYRVDWHKIFFKLSWYYEKLTINKPFLHLWFLVGFRAASFILLVCCMSY